MFCSNCGKEVAADRSFCTNCGAPAPKDDAPATQQIPEQPPTPIVAPTEVQPAVSVDAGMPPQQWQPVGSARPKSKAMVIGAVVAVIVVLAGAGVGLWLGLRGDNSGAGGSGTAAAGGTSTTATIPGLDGGSGATGSTALADATMGEYRTAVGEIVAALESDNVRIPELADIIDANTPGVPQAVYDELQHMLTVLQADHDAVAEITPPPAFEDANLYLMQATTHMESRIQATMDGIQAGWDAGATGPALPFYSKGRQQRDAYLASMRHFYDYVPKGTLPGD